MKALIPLGGFSPGYALPLLVATLPAVWLIIRGCSRLFRLTPAQLLETTALLCAPSLLLDGAVLTFAPGLHRPQGPEHRAIAGFLLCFVGVTLSAASIMSGGLKPRS